jgi:hypothetical protein
MPYRTLADLVLTTHFAFVVFAVFGAFLVLKWRRLAWIHIPAALWAGMIELAGWICPLTHLEYWLQVKGGASVEKIGFIEQYLVPLLYPTPLTRRLQILQGAIVLSVNVLIYGWILWRNMKARLQGHTSK